MLNVIDISEYQRNMNLATMFNKNPDLGGVIVKATGGVNIWQEKTFKPWADWLVANNKPMGFYHFLDDDFKASSGQKEAEFFVSKTKDYFGHGIPIADYEMQAKNLGTGFLKDFLDTVYALTGVKPMVYCSQGLANNKNMTSIAEAGYKLWVAQYPNYNPVYGFQSNPWKKGAVGPFGAEVMRQYTSQLYIPGWRKNLDASIFYGDVNDWNRLVGIEPVFPPAKKSVDEIAREVINGIWGNGQARRRNIEAAGYNYDEIQARVNEILGTKPKQTAESLTKIARDVIAGKYGNGAIRVLRLRLAGYDPNKVQAEVNRILSGK